VGHNKTFQNLVDEGESEFSKVHKDDIDFSTTLAKL
jgi:hypothetical protein